ncbi:ST13 [Lepeophtheirus salmonis]|uniref:ST13 n=1 Tax=Lepeophtheirus salmonis TaxID=72036 RepID=A0A7R8CYI4_LEPSM|nr:ST13 [Lepeophtheirus salmonis]CAF2969504.1 ST13 [Lepeophtheirus salmonis]
MSQARQPEFERELIKVLKQCPHIIHLPELDFFRDYILEMGGKIPTQESSKPTEPKKETKAEEPKVEKEEKMEEVVEEDEEMESEVELDLEGVIEDNDDTEHEMGDPSKVELSESEMELFENKRSEAMSSYSSGDWEKSVDFFTEAIKINPTSAAMFAKRGTCYLKIKKPKACIRDCNMAIQLNPDNASAYKFRGRAHRLLGQFLDAVKDLRTACKIDFDEQADEWLKEVTPNYD